MTATITFIIEDETITLGFPQPVGGGEANTAANVGAGAGVFRDKAGPVLNLRTIVGVGGISASEVGDTIEIDGGGAGDVDGPASSTDNRAAVFDGTTGKLIKGPDAAVDFAGQSLTNVGTVDGRDLSVDGVKLDGIEPGAKDDQTITAGTGLSGGGTGDVSLTVNYGTTPGTACVGDDPRLSDSRPPTGTAGGDLTGTYPNPTIGPGAVSDVEVAAGNKDGPSGVPSLRTLGSGATQAVAGNDSRIPSQGENDALAGTSGTPSGSNRYVTNADPRNTDPRAPSGAATGDLGGSYPNPSVERITTTTGPTSLAVGAIADGEFLKRSGGSVIGATSVSPDEKTKVTGADTTPDFLGAKINAGAGIAKATLFPGSNEALDLSVKYGTTAATATEGNDSRVPTQNENDALQGTDSAPSNTNRYVTDSDPRNSNARAPTSHSANHKHGGGDEVATATPAANAIPKAGAGGTIDDAWLPASITRDSELTAHTGDTGNPHGTDLGNLGSGTLAELNAVVTDATLIDTGDARLSDDRTASGLRTATGVVSISAAAAPSVGQILKATSATTATWQADDSGGGGPPLSNAAPVDVDTAAASAGISSDASRADHKHDVATAAASGLDSASSSTEGTALSLARSDHAHEISEVGTVSTIQPDDLATDGVAAGFARKDHKHAIAADVAGSISIGDAAAEGSSSSFARSDHTHGLTAPAAPANVTKAAASAGSSANVARADHKHDIATATPVAIGSANAEGAATSIARSDHVHDHGAQAGGSTHALAIASGAAGFMSGADKSKLDALPAGGFGGDFQSATSSAVSSTTLTTPQTKVSITTPALTGTYFVLATWSMSATVKAKEGNWRLQNTTDAVGYGEAAPFNPSPLTNNGFMTGAASAVVSFTGAAKTFAIQWWSAIGDEVNIKQAKIAFWRVA